MSIFTLILIVAIAILVTGGIVYVETAQRRIPISYARRVVGRRVRGFCVRQKLGSRQRRRINSQDRGD